MATRPLGYRLAGRATVGGWLTHLAQSKGLTNLRVVNPSVMPEVPSTVTSLTTIMIAERIYERAYAN